MDLEDDFFTTSIIMESTTEPEPTDLFTTLVSTTLKNPYPAINNNYSRTLNAYDYAIPAVGSLAIVLNLIVVISSGLILKKGQMPKTTYILLGNVAMSDLLTALTTVFGQMYPKTYRGYYTCCLQIGMIVSSTLVSVYSVGLIAIDRFLYIVHGLKYQKWIYPSRVRIAIGFTWVLGLIIGFLPLMGWNGDTQNGKKCWFILLAPKELVVLTVFVGSVPLILVVVLYSIILYQALKNIKRLQEAPKPAMEIGGRGNNLRMFVGNPQQQAANQPNKWRAIKVVLFTSGAFVLSWGPYFVACTIYVLTENATLLRNLTILIASPLAILGFCNTLIDPLIYAWWHKGFREFVKRQYASMRRKRGGSTSPSKETSTTSATSETPSVMTN